ncbi:MAG: hypothetical protein IAG10_26865 [Planctomycetaceae bacterium]|nr:hypothetical protein [Planctomycetaceae bacterium]
MSSAPSPLPPAWENIISTFERGEEWIVRWTTEGQILPAQRDVLVQSLRERLENARSLAAQGAEIPSLPGILPPQPNELPAVRALRLWRFLGNEIAQHKAAGRLTLSQAHALAEECRERITSLKRRLLDDGITVVTASTQPSSSAQKPASESGVRDVLKEWSQPDAGVAWQPPVSSDTEALPTLEMVKPRRNILEMLLDPRSIQWLMGIGGALMAVGLVILLWVKNYFTPPVMAMVMGITNIAIMGGGWGIIQKTRYQLAGKGLTLLACLVMPLNLWYYHSQGLVTLDGHLWVVAAIMCGLYAASAWTLKDEMFVYVFNAGVAMTGLLLLADMNKFVEIAAPATLLVLLGLAGIHAERAFGENDGPFSRKRFGLAFFASGHVLLGSGLLMLFIAQLAGDWLYDAWFKSVYLSFQAVPSPICGELRWLSLVLVLVGIYAYIYSDIVVRKHGAYIHFAAALLLWAEVLVVQLLHLTLGVDAIIAVLAVTSLAVNLTQATLTRDQKMTRAFPVFGLLLGLLPVLLGIVEYLRFLGFRSAWEGHPPEWNYVGAMVLAAVASRLGAFIYRNSGKWLPTAYHFATAAATLVAAVAALAACGLERWQEHAPIMMLIPIAYLVAAKLYGNRGPSEPLMAVAHTATVVMLASSLTSAFYGFSNLAPEKNLNLALAAFFAEAAVFYGLATSFQRKPFCVHLATLMAGGSLWQMLMYFGVTSANVYLLTFAFLGLGLLLVYRFSVLEQTAAAPLTEAAFQAANSLLSLAFVASVCKGLASLASDAFSTSQKVEWGFVGFSVTMLVIAMLSVAIVKVAGWRRWYVVNVVAQGALTLLGLHQLINLNGWQQAELFSVIVGLLLLAVGHLGWYREQERENDLVSTSLFFGSLLAVVPLAIAACIHRWNPPILMVDEAGFLFVSVLLLGTGLVFRLKSTTLVGSLSTVLYFVTLLIFVPWGKLDTVAILIIVGGSTLFGTGLVLAFFRDRLLTLPERIKNREGIFKVLNWR